MRLERPAARTTAWTFADDGLFAEPSQNQQIAWIDRHARAQHLAAGLPDRRGNDIVEIAERGRAEDDDHVVRRR